MKAPAGFLATVSALAVAGFASGIGGIVGYRAALQVGRTTAAEHMARAVQIAAADVPGGATAEAIVEELARSTGYRVTLFGPAGEGMADSAFPSSAFSGDAGADRPEVTAARLRVTGSATRPSLLDGRTYVYTARRVHWSGQSAVLRLAVPLGPLKERARRAGLRTALSVLGIGLLATALTRRAALLAGGHVRRVTAFLRQLGTGPDRPKRLPLSSVVELAQVASVANRLSTDLEERLEEGRRKLTELRSLMDQVAEGLLALTEDARVLSINPAGEQLLGLTDVIPYSPVGTIIREPELRDLLEASVVRPALEEELEVGGRILRVKTQKSPTGGSVVLLLDVTEVRRLEAVRTDFVANASHELKTPLTVIRGAAETVLQGGLPDELEAQFLASIQGNAVRLQGLVDDLLDLSRFESGAWVPAGRPVAVHEIVHRVWEDIVQGGENEDIAFRVAGEGTVCGDESAVYQVFQNLLENAIRYVPSADGEILVEIQEAGEWIEVAVHDNGAGIPAAALTRIFERFYRVDAARSRQAGGTGLGLAIVRHLVTAMGGRVWAESTLGLGTAMRFRLPAVHGESAHPVHDGAGEGR